MINRVLIRIKVVQILYSYLLTRSEFKIDDAPESASRDRRYAYQAYVDLLLLILKLSGYSVGGNERPINNVNDKLSGNKVAKALSTNNTIRSIILRDNNGVSAFNPIVDNLLAKIVKSSVFTEYSKTKKHDLADDVKLWTTIFETIIARDAQVEEVLRSSSSFTQIGFQQGIANVCNTLRSYNDSRQLLTNTLNELERSQTKAYELYLGLLKLIIDITDEQARRLDAARNKYLATSDDLNPNTKLIDNALCSYLRDSENLASLVKEYKVNLFTPTSNIVKVLLDKILESDIYKEYVSTDVADFASDVEFWRSVMKSIILPSEALSEELEDSSVFWNDDLYIMGTFVVKTLRQIGQSQGKQIQLLPKYKDHDDEVFGAELFMYAVNNYDTYRKYIDMFIDQSHWDPERMAYMDIVIMITAIAEIINYPAIPVPVSINEYVEIANNYSTEKSGAFINGILFSVVQYLNENGIINKK